MGLPSGYTTVVVYGFRGTQQLFERTDGQDLRLKYGHVGLSIDQGQKIYGFNPSFEEGISLKEIREILISGIPSRGKVTDDTVVFELARNNGAEVREHYYHLDENSFSKLTIQLFYDRDHSPLSDKQYSFPSGFSTGSLNCATYLTTLDIKTPYPSGILKDYFPQ